MPHQVHLRTFGRETGHRRAMLRNLTLSVLRYERVKTTEAKAKEVRRLVDRLIGLGKNGSLAARRRAAAFLPEPEIVEKLFNDVAPRYANRGASYVRTVRLGHRVGDSAPLMLIELIPVEVAAAPSEEGEKPRRRSAPSGEAKAPAKKTVAKKTTAKKAGSAGAKAKA